MKAKMLVCVAASAFLVTFGIAIVTAEHDRPGQIESHDSDDVRVRVGFDYAHAQGIAFNLRHRDRELVGLGSYLVNAIGGCNDCHTAPPYTKDPYSRARRTEADQQRVLSRRRIAVRTLPSACRRPRRSRATSRPSKTACPRDLTFAQFRHVIRTGEDPDNPGQVLRVMPWPIYQTMTDHDLRAIYEFLLSIPAIPKDTCGVPSV